MTIVHRFREMVAAMKHGGLKTVGVAGLIAMVAAYPVLLAVALAALLLLHASLPIAQTLRRGLARQRVTRSPLPQNHPPRPILQSA